eukprot:COSAG02_NODE_6311_length_3662_cov_3.062026_7_plen_144_part_01
MESDQPIWILRVQRRCGTTAQVPVIPELSHQFGSNWLQSHRSNLQESFVAVASVCDPAQPLASLPWQVYCCPQTNTKQITFATTDLGPGAVAQSPRVVRDRWTPSVAEHRSVLCKTSPLPVVGPSSKLQDSALRSEPAYLLVLS